MFFEQKYKPATWYETAGNPRNQCLIMIHGLAADNHAWAPQKERYPGESYFVVSYDLLGHGRSGDADAADLEVWSRQLLELMDHEKIESAVLMGSQLGALVALRFASEFHNRVDKLVICDVPKFGHALSDKMKARTELTHLQVMKMRGEKALVQSLTSHYKYPYEEPTVHYFHKQVGRLRFDQLMLAQKAIQNSDLDERLGGVRARTLVLAGADMGMKHEKIGSDLAASLQWSTFKVVRRTQFPSNLVNPENYDAEVIKFLNSY